MGAHQQDMTTGSQTWWLPEAGQPVHGKILVALKARLVGLKDGQFLAG